MQGVNIQCGWGDPGQLTMSRKKYFFPGLIEFGMPYDDFNAIPGPSPRGKVTLQTVTGTRTNTSGDNGEPAAS